MDILFHCNWWPNDEKYSGIFIKEHAIAISNFCRVHVLNIKFTFNKKIMLFKINQKFYQQNENLFINEIIVNFPPIRIFQPIIKIYKKRILYNELINLQKSYDFDLIHLNVLDSETKWVLNYPNFSKKKFVITEHNGYFYKEQNLLNEEQFDKFRKKTKKAFEHPLLKLVMPVSNSLKTQLKEIYLIDKPMEVIPNVVNINNFIKNDSIKKNKITICLIANWEYPKCPQLFINSLQELPEDELKDINIIWGGFGSQYDQIKNSIDKGKFNINFVDKLKKTEVYQILSQSDLLVHPTISESFSCIVVEALCLGTPVLSNKTGIIEEIIDNTNGISTPYNNQNEFNFAFKKILNNIRISIYNRETIRENALSIFSTEIVGKKIFNLYNKVIDNNV